MHWRNTDHDHSLQMHHTSETVQGQVYFPIINYIRECRSLSHHRTKLNAAHAVGIATIVMVAAFKNLGNMTNAYGFAVSAVMIVTTSVVAIQTYYIKHLPWFVAVGFFLVSAQ